MARGARFRLAAAAAAAVAIAVASCGREAIELDAKADGGPDAPGADAANVPPGDPSTCSTSAPPPACLALGGACGVDGDCCTGFCAGGACVANGSCLAPGAACSARADCCSGDCEPIGAGGARVCTAVCKPDGSACQRASDCCGLDCNGGVCGGAECRREGDDCTNDAQCCSGACGAQEHKCSLHAGCRSAGEDCSSGGGQGCCFRCGSNGRCDIGPGPCRLPGMICEQTSDCCTGTCAQDGSGKTVCGGALLPDGATCTAGFACTSGACVGNPPRCGPPVPACAPSGATCTDDAACCSRSCSGGICQASCTPLR